MRKFTVKEAEDAARTILLDTYEGAYRFEPKEVFEEISRALGNLRREQPASKYVAGLLVSCELDVPANFTPTSLAAFRATELNMERRWMEAVVYYVVHKMYLKDDPDTTNANLAQRYLELYTAAKGG